MTRRASRGGNGNQRGSAEARRRRKVWLLLTFSPDLGPDEAWCEFNCGAVVTLETITVDRHPIMGCQGGTYRRDNIRPACPKCNYSNNKVPA